MKNNVIYPIVLTYEDNNILVTFPDFLYDNVTYGKTMEEAIQNAKEVLTLELAEYLDRKEEFPKATSGNDIRKFLKKNQELVYIDMWLPYELSLRKTIYKKKTLSIPTWLDMLATNKNINFSKVLQDALKKELNID